MFHELLYKPLFNGLIFFYDYLSFHDFGLAIIFLTVFIQIILFPLFYKSARDQSLMQRLAPKIKDIQAHHKEREAQAQAMLALYREHKVNPLSGLLVLFLVQLPILIALYQVFLYGFSPDALRDLYSFMPRPESLHPSFLGIIDLTLPNTILILLASLTQFLQGKLSLAALTKGSIENKEPSFAESMGRQMVYIGPVLTAVFFFTLNLPSAVALYWLTSSLFSLGQQKIINKRLDHTSSGLARA